MEAGFFLVQIVWRSRFRQTSQLSSSAVSFLWKQSEPEESTHAGVETKLIGFRLFWHKYKGAMRAVFDLCRVSLVWKLDAWLFFIRRWDWNVFFVELIWFLKFQSTPGHLSALSQVNYLKHREWQKTQFSPHLAFINHPDLIVILEFEHARGVSKTPNFFWNTWSALVDVLVKCGR